MTNWDKRVGRWADRLLAGTRAGQIVHSESKGAPMGRVSLPRGFELRDNWVSCMTTTQRTPLSASDREWIATKLMGNRKVATIAEMTAEELAPILTEGLRLVAKDALKVAGEMIAFASHLMEEFDLFRRGKIGTRSMDVFLEQTPMLQMKNAVGIRKACEILLSDSPYELADANGVPVNPLRAMVALEYQM